MDTGTSNKTIKKNYIIVVKKCDRKKQKSNNSTKKKIHTYASYFCTQVFLSQTELQVIGDCLRIAFGTLTKLESNGVFTSTFLRDELEQPVVRYLFLGVCVCVCVCIGVLRCYVFFRNFFDYFWRLFSL